MLTIAGSASSKLVPKLTTNNAFFPTLPSVFNCFHFAKKNIYITSPIVIPAPVILIN